MSDVKPQVPVVNVTTFKSTGKYYAESNTDLAPEHSKLHGYELAQLFRHDDASVQQYRCVMSSFSQRDFKHVIQVTYPDHVQDFCFFLLDPRS